jgi:hypothetical protein
MEQKEAFEIQNRHVPTRKVTKVLAQRNRAYDLRAGKTDNRTKMNAKPNKKKNKYTVSKMFYCKHNWKPKSARLMMREEAELFGYAKSNPLFGHILVGHIDVTGQQGLALAVLLKQVALVQKFAEHPT